MALTRTKATKLSGPDLRLMTDDDKLVYVRKRGEFVYLHIEGLFNDAEEASARLRLDQARRLVEELK